jgi:YVTN family beta-propeller protein
MRPHAVAAHRRVQGQTGREDRSWRQPNGRAGLLGGSQLEPAEPPPWRGGCWRGLYHRPSGSGIVSLVRELHPGDELAGYLIESIVGRGGMGIVYRATHIRLQRVDAVKVIAPDLADEVEFRSRFERESRVAAQIDHPNVIPIYAAGEEEGLLYIAMRFIEGTDVRAVLKQEGRIEHRRAAQIVAAVGSALDAAHENGLVHRDVKPANVLLARRRDREHVYLTDFGLAKVIFSGQTETRTGMFVGTTDYVSPEQVLGGRLDARSDVYSLGCTLFHMLTGQVPYPTEVDAAKLVAHTRDPMPSVLMLAPDVSPEFDAVIARATAKEPEERYPSAGDLARAALAAAEGLTFVGGQRSVARGPAAPAKTTELSPPSTATTSPAGSTARQDDARTVLPPAGSTARQDDATAFLPPAESTARQDARATSRLSVGELDTDVDRPAEPAPLRGPRSRRRFILLGGAVVIVAAIVGVVVATGGGSGNHARSSASVRPLVKGAIPVGNSPNGMVIGQSTVWVANAGDGTITRIDRASGHVLSTTSYASRREAAAPIAMWGQGLWVGDAGNGTVDEINPTSGTTIRKIAVGGQPYALNNVSGSLWIANSNDTIARMAAGSTTPSVIHVGSGPKRIGFTNTSLWADNQNEGTVTRIDPTTGQVLGTIPIGGHPTAMAVPQGRLWVADVKQNTVTRRDLVTLRAIGSPIHVGRGPQRMAVDNGSLWTANSGDGTVTRIDASTGRVLATIRVGGYPDAIAAANGVVWVALWSRPTVEYHGPPGGVARIDEATGKVIGN